MFNIGDRVGFLFYDGTHEGVIVDYNPLRKVFVVETDEILAKNFSDARWLDLEEDELGVLV